VVNSSVELKFEIKEVICRTQELHREEFGSHYPVLYITPQRE